MVVGSSLLPETSECTLLGTYRVFLQLFTCLPIAIVSISLFQIRDSAQ